MALAEVTRILVHERRLLCDVLDAVGAVRSLPPSSPGAWRVHAEHRLEACLDELRHVEVLRAVEVHRVAADLGLPVGSTLRELAAGVSEPDSARLLELRESMVALVAAIDDVAERSA